MIDLHLPWLEVAILLPLLGSLVVWRINDSTTARWWSIIFSGFALVAAGFGLIDFYLLERLELKLHPATAVIQADDPGHLMTRLLGREILIINDLNAPLLPLVALLYFLAMLATLRTKVRRFSFGWTLLSESLAIATVCTSEHWLLVTLLIASVVPVFLELRSRRRPTRVFLLHMGAFAMLLVGGAWCIQYEDHRELGLWLLVAAVWIRSGLAPLHCWITDLFEHATFGTALLFVTPLSGAYVACIMLLPHASDTMMQVLSFGSLVTAVYAAGLALVQKEARRFYCFLFLSHSALVLVGLEMTSPLGVTGGLCVWLSVGMSLGGFGLTLRALEARRGRLMLTEYLGLYEHTPALAVCFVLTGLASVGFPGTIGFVGTELLVDGAVAANRYTGFLVVVAGALNGIAIIHSYLIIFTGKRYFSSVSLQIGNRERFAVLTLAALIMCGGLAPQLGVEMRYHAAVALLKSRGKWVEPPPGHGHTHGGEHSTEVHSHPSDLPNSPKPEAPHKE